MITLVARWDDVQLSPVNEWNMYRPLRGAFKIDRFIFIPVMSELDGYAIDQFDTMDEALAAAVGERAFLEPSGTKGLVELPQGDIVFIVGNTAEGNAEYAQADEMYRIGTEGTVDHNHLYGVNAAAIALANDYDAA